MYHQLELRSVIRFLKYISKDHKKDSNYVYIVRQEQEDVGFTVTKYATIESYVE